MLVVLEPENLFYMTGFWGEAIGILEKNGKTTIIAPELEVGRAKEEGTDFCQLPGGRGGKFKFPTLVELNNFLFNENFDEAHNATADVEATARCFFELLRNKSIIPKAFGDESLFYEKVKRNFKNKVKPIGLSHVNLRDASKLLVKNDFFDVKKTGQFVQVLNTLKLAHQKYFHHQTKQCFFL